MSMIAYSAGNHHMAARLSGHAGHLRDVAGTPVHPIDRPPFERSARTARTALGPTAYDAAYAEGRALTMDEAVAYALGEVTWDELRDEVSARVGARE
jgi:hypothetical protein